MISIYAYSIAHLISFDNLRELLIDFYTSSAKRKPDQIIIFRYAFPGTRPNVILFFLNLVEAIYLIIEFYCHFLDIICLSLLTATFTNLSCFVLIDLSCLSPVTQSFH